MVRYDFPSRTNDGRMPVSSSVDLVQEVLGLGLGEDVVAHRRVEAAERAQLLDPERVGQEAAVEDHVDIEREPVLVTERHHRGLHGRRAAFVAERFEDAGAQLVGVELAGVDQQVGPVAHRRQQPPLVGDRLLHAPGGQRVAAAGALVAADQHVVAGVEEEHPHPVAPLARSASSTSGRSSKYVRTRLLPPPRPITSATRSISAPGRLIISAIFRIRAAGRLSMTNQPRSSRDAAAVERPAPDIPVTTRNSLTGYQPLAHAVVHREPTGSGSQDSAMQLLQRGGPHRVDPAQLLDQAGLAGRPQARDAVQHALGHALAPLLAVEGDGEAVRLVPDPLEQVEGIGPTPQADGFGRAGAVDLLELLGQRGQLRSRRPGRARSTTRSATPSWPLPPSTSSRLGR